MSEPDILTGYKPGQRDKVQKTDFQIDRPTPQKPMQKLEAKGNKTIEIEKQCQHLFPIK